MPPLPTNAPTEGLPALVFWALAGLGILFFIAVRLLPSGRERLEARQKDNDSAIAILQGQVNDLRAEVAGLKQEVARMNRAEERNREYRHALANQAHALLAWAEAAYNIMGQIIEEWGECPDYYKKQRVDLKHPVEIVKRFPLPEYNTARDDG